MNPDFVPKKLEPRLQRAIMDLGAKPTAKSSYKIWTNPRLDSGLGFHTDRDMHDSTWWQVTFDGSDFYTASQMTIKKRGDGCCKNP